MNDMIYSGNIETTSGNIRGSSRALACMNLLLRAITKCGFQTCGRYTYTFLLLARKYTCCTSRIRMVVTFIGTNLAVIYTQRNCKRQ